MRTRMHDYSQVAILCVQVVALIGLFWYVIETMKIRKAAQQQVETSLDLIRALSEMSWPARIKAAMSFKTSGTAWH